MLCVALCIGPFPSKIFKIIMLSALGILFVLFLILGLTLKKKLLLVFAVVFAITILPVSNLLVRQNTVNKNKVFDGERVLVTGRICKNTSYTANGNLKITLDDLSFASADYFAEPSGTFCVYVKPANLEVYNFVTGKYVEVICEPTIFEINKKDISRMSTGVIGMAFCNSYEIELLDEEKLSFKEDLKNKAYTKLEAWNVKHAELGYAMMFGDTSYVDSDILNIYRDTGIAHLLAVSGFHVSIIAAIASFILDKFKLNKYANFGIIAIVLLFYCYLCNFSVSVVRASFMISMALFCRARGKPYDNLSSLCMIASIILIINPLKLFNISFMLSFSSVLIIILTVSQLERFFSKFLYKKLASLLALTIGLQIGMFVIQLVCFGSYPVLSFFSNFISVPIQSLAFVSLIVGTLLSLVFPFLSFVPRLFGILTGVVVKLNGFISGLGLMINFASLGLIWIVIVLLLLFMLSDYIFIKKKWKLLSALGLIVTGVAIQILMLL